MISILWLIVPMLFAGEPVQIWPAAEWKTSTPEEQGLSSRRLHKMYTDKHFVGNLILVRNGFLVAEHYDQAQGKKYAPHIFSCTKGVISALIGIALEQKHLKNIQQPILDYFPEYPKAKNDKRRQQITLYHLLTMTSGIMWHEGKVPYMNQSNDWIQYIFSKPMAATPGKIFTYSSANAHLLSAILQKTTNMTTFEYAKRYLFKPLGITKIQWEKNFQGVYIGGWGLRMSLEDMAKFGYLYIRGGKWKEQQVIPKKWVTASTKKLVKQSDESGSWDRYGYGYAWNTPPDMPYATPTLVGGDRHHTYLITLIPDLDIVLIYAGTTNHNQLFQLLRRYLLPAVTQ